MYLFESSWLLKYHKLRGNSTFLWFLPLLHRSMFYALEGCHKNKTASCWAILDILHPVDAMSPGRPQDLTFIATCLYSPTLVPHFSLSSSFQGISLSLSLSLSLFFNCLFLRERERERGREKGRHRIWSRLQALSCQHRARHWTRTHEPWDHDLSQPTEPPRQFIS